MLKHISTSKEKMDAVLGITGGQSVDDFLNDLSLDTSKIESALSSIDDNVKSAVEDIDRAAAMLSETNNVPTMLQISNMELSMKEIEEMISLSKQIFKHIAESILASDLIDSELVHAASVLMEGIHINISEFVQLYKSKQQFIDKVKFSLLQQEQKKELLMLKHKLDMEKLKESKKDIDAIETEGTVSFNTDDIIRFMNEQDKLKTT